ncbi:MAG TPA: DoxX family protein [Candidatus Limnocylindrales bacterium]|nr:DoxX family protein [Candidatus Limnocylindrales bacterium]
MNNVQSSGGACHAIREYGGLFARWLVGGLFLYMGLSKALDPVGFLKLVHQYQMVNSPWLLNSIASFLPWFEAFCGLLLLAGVAVRGSALISALMLLPFTVLVLRRALGIAAAEHLPLCAVKFDCGCGTGEVFICRKVVENSFLFLLSCWLVTGPGRRLAARYSLFRQKVEVSLENRELPSQSVPKL